MGHPAATATGGATPTRWLRVAVGCGVLVATAAIAPWSGAEEATDVAAASGQCTPAPVAASPRDAGDLRQTISVTVPAIAIVDVVDGMPSRVWTNSGRLPRADDEMYVRHDQAHVEASPEVRAQVLGATWVPVASASCRPEAWVARP